MADDQPDRVSVPDPGHDRRPARRDRLPAPHDRARTLVGLEHGRRRPDHARQRRALPRPLILAEPGGLSIDDAGSATGTFVNGEKVEGEHPLQEGDRICLGPPGAKGQRQAARGLRAGATAAAGGGGARPRPSTRRSPRPRSFDLSAETALRRAVRRRRRLRPGPAARGDRGDRPGGGRGRRRSSATPLPPAPLAAPPRGRRPRARRCRVRGSSPAACAEPRRRPLPRRPPPARRSAAAADRAAAARAATARRRPPPPPQRAPRPRSPTTTTDLPSIPVAERPPEPAPRAEFPPLRPAPRPAGGKAKGRAPAKRRRVVRAAVHPGRADPGRGSPALGRGRGARVVLLPARDPPRGRLGDARHRRAGPGGHPGREALRRARPRETRSSSASRRRR